MAGQIVIRGIGVVFFFEIIIAGPMFNGFQFPGAEGSLCRIGQVLFQDQSAAERLGRGFNRKRLRSPKGVLLGTLDNVIRRPVGPDPPML